MRGATGRQGRHGRQDRNFNPRAPCGARPSTALWRLWAPYFNPRAPCGARHGQANSADALRKFQSTRPMRGATQSGADLPPLGQISIHAPHAGRDGLPGAGVGTDDDFNPRAPCGARLRLPLWRLPLRVFQSTRPMRGATAKVYKITLHTFATKGNS